MPTTALRPCTTGAIRASDADRDTALDLLRDHWLAGRLAIEEYEARGPSTRRAYRHAPPPR